MKMKRSLYPALVLLAFFPALLFGVNEGPVLVLGFDSPLLDEVQDRFLREAVMKKFIARGFAVVPVMAVERLSLEQGARGIRKVSREMLRELCLRADAEVAVTGTLAAPTGKGGAKSIFERDLPLTVELLVYRRQSDTVGAFTLKAAGNDDPLLLMEDIAEMVTRAAADPTGR